MKLEEVQNIVSRIDISSFPVPLRLSTKMACGMDGVALVSAELNAPDVKEEGRGPRDGFWPPHSATFELATAGEADVVAATRGAIVKALGHEVDEHFKLDGALVTDPHPAIA